MPSFPLPPLTRKRVTALVVAIPVALWLVGYLTSRSMGSEPGSAGLKATAYALSWPPGFFTLWVAAGRPRSERGVRLKAWSAVFAANGFAPVTILELKAAPWPFLEMLKFGVTVSTAAGLTIGLMIRGWLRFSAAVDANETRRHAGPPPDGASPPRA